MAQQDASEAWTASTTGKAYSIVGITEAMNFKNSTMYLQQRSQSATQLSQKLGTSMPQDSTSQGGLTLVL